MAVKFPDFIISKLDWLANEVRAHSLVADALRHRLLRHRIDGDRFVALRHRPVWFGSDAFQPRQCDVMIVAGRVVMKMVPVMQRIWQQMPEPKWCISMGACASSGGVFDTYAVVQGIDRFIPVDVYVPGCPPRPEQLIRAVLDLQEKIKATGTIDGREFTTRTTVRRPRPAGRELGWRRRR